MARLAGSTSFLVLRHGDKSNEPTIEFRPSFDDVVSKWGAGDRQSPVFPYHPSSIPQFENYETSWLTFVGPVHPTELDPQYFAAAFVTVGYFNVILFSVNEEQRQGALCFALGTGSRYEEWQVSSDGSFTVTDMFDMSPSRIRPSSGYRLTAQTDERHLTGAAHGYRAEVANSVALASWLNSPFAEEIERYDALLRRRLGDTSHQDVTKLKTLVLASTAISRHAAQSFSGISPILKTRGDIAPHSLLGVATASEAVARIRRFVERVITKTRYYDRIQSLDDVPPLGDRLDSLGDDHAVWGKDHLFDYGEPTRFVSVPGTRSLERPFESKARWTEEYRFPVRKLAEDEPKALPQPSRRLIPLLNYLSAKDGFRSTSISLSAPLEIISSCNTASWSLMTLTHELSHAIIDDVLARILPRLDDLTGLSRAFDVSASPDASQSLLDDIRAYLITALLDLVDPNELAKLKNIDASQYVDLVRPHYRRAIETLTHVFDYVHFYRKNADRYISGIWASWAVIPNIKHRLHEYIVRSLCALHIENIDEATEAKSSAALTIKQLVGALRVARQNHPEALYIADAIESLKKTKVCEQLQSQLEAREKLIRIVNTFLSSSEFATVLDRPFADPEPEAFSHHGLDAHDAMSFDSGYVGNPLRFLESEELEKRALQAKSAWLLNMIAIERPPIAEVDRPLNPAAR